MDLPAEKLAEVAEPVLLSADSKAEGKKAGMGRTLNSGLPLEFVHQHFHLHVSSLSAHFLSIHRVP